jgi:hypothetical protein
MYSIKKSDHVKPTFVSLEGFIWVQLTTKLGGGGEIYFLRSPFPWYGWLADQLKVQTSTLTRAISSPL